MLFDLDGVVTPDRRGAHARLVGDVQRLPRRVRRRRATPRRTPTPTTSPTSTASRATTGCATSSPRAASTARGAPSDPLGDRRGSATARTTPSTRCSSATASTAYPGLGRCCSTTCATLGHPARRRLVVGQRARRAGGRRPGRPVRDRRRRRGRHRAAACPASRRPTRSCTPPSVLGATAATVGRARGRRLRRARRRGRRLRRWSSASTAAPGRTP